MGRAIVQGSGEDFGGWLHRRRVDLGLTREAPADRCGVAVRTLRYIEGGRTAAPRPDTRRAIVTALDQLGARAAIHPQFSLSALVSEGRRIAAHGHGRTGDDRTAVAHLLRAVRLAEEGGDACARADALFGLALIHDAPPSTPTAWPATPCAGTGRRSAPTGRRTNWCR